MHGQAQKVTHAGWQDPHEAENMHQGRVRNVPHMEGFFKTSIFIEGDPQEDDRLA